jgi:UDP-N-acetylmuramyl pentapeptide phosphotransferase/UDP-N-acetylglucosamine-1-phosphate transferase
MGTAVLCSFLLALMLVATRKAHGRFTMDLPGAVQKFHKDPTPRVGGIAIYLGLAAALFMAPEGGAKTILATLLIAGLPALVFGLLEDLTGQVGVTLRLLATTASGALACLIGGVALTRLGLPWLDPLLAVAPLAIAFTALAVGGVANAINIIDGFHGLASGAVILALLGLTTIAARVGDTPLVLACLTLAAAVTGFWLVNFPLGRLFLGDGGAYFSGFALAWIAVLLPMRNAEVSPWASLMVCAYPITEVIYSMLRRRRMGQPIGHPDNAHLHSLVAIKLVQRRLPLIRLTLKSATVSALMWIHVAVTGALAVTFYRQTFLLIALACAYAFAYHLCYRALARVTVGQGRGADPQAGMAFARHSDRGGPD